MPFRDEGGARPLGFGPQAAEYEADARDVVRGAYEVGGRRAVPAGR